MSASSRQSDTWGKVSSFFHFLLQIYNINTIAKISKMKEFTNMQIFQYTNIRVTFPLLYFNYPPTGASGFYFCGDNMFLLYAKNIPWLFFCIIFVVATRMAQAPRKILIFYQYADMEMLPICAAVWQEYMDGCCLTTKKPRPILLVVTNLWICMLFPIL